MKIRIALMSMLVSVIYISAAYAGEIVRNVSDSGMEFVYMPAGCFDMGSNEGSFDEKPIRRVCLKAFFMSKYEVTQAQWQQVAGNNPSEFQRKGEQRPVEQVSYNDVKAWITTLNKKEQDNYALPSEEQWEYACRAGGNHDRYCGYIIGAGLTRIGWYNFNNTLARTHAVGQKIPNASGLYDMSGNVWEWVEGCGGNGYADMRGSDSDQSKADCLYHVRRGGSWHSSSEDLRAANRSSDGPAGKDSRTGFRLIKTIP